MTGVIPTDTAITIMIVISCVYSNLTLVLAICSCCYCYHKKKYKLRDKESSDLSRASERNGAGTSQSWGSGSTSIDSSVWKAQSTSQSRISSEGSSSRSSGGVCVGLSGGERTEGELSGGASPHLLKHRVLPPIGESQKEPPPSHASCQDFKVLTVHKSTLRRGKKVEPCPDAKSGSEQGGGGMKVANDAETDKLPPIVVTPPKRKKPQPLKKPKVARTDSTKPLMEDDNDSPMELTGSAMWPWSQQRTLLADEYVLENPVATEQKEVGAQSLNSHTKGLNDLQDDIMEIITSL